MPHPAPDPLLAPALPGPRGVSLEAFVAMLVEGGGIELPYCWRRHLWIAARLAALQDWLPTVEADPEKLHVWWALGIGSLQRDIEAHFRSRVSRRVGLECMWWGHRTPLLGR